MLQTAGIFSWNGITYETRAAVGVRRASDTDVVASVKAVTTVGHSVGEEFEEQLSEVVDALLHRRHLGSALLQCGRRCY